jgi:tetratricopeptide (TPR) repeat protein
MAKKRNPKEKPGTDGLLQRVRRDLEKGDAKAALKNARQCFRQEATSEHRNLLERAYVARVEQLHRKKHPAEARDVLTQLLDFGPRLPEVSERIPRLKVLVGMQGADAAAVLEEDPQLLVRLVDEAVLHPQATPPQQDGLKEQLARVREALLAIERGEDERASGLLKEIPRNSPLSDWKLFARGLIAFYAGDRERTKQNWKRLDKERPAWRIAQTLRVAGGDLPAEECAFDVSPGLKRLERTVQSDPADALLKRLSEQWRSGKHRRFIEGLSSFRVRFAATHAAELDAIVEMVWKRAVRDEDEGLLRQLTRAAPPPALDPHWHRAWALLFELQDERTLNDVEDQWRAYVRDLEQSEELGNAERDVAIGLVYHQLADQFEYCARDYMEGDLFHPPDLEHAKEIRRQAVKFYRRSIEYAPTLTEAYQKLAEIHQEQEEPQRAAEAFEMLLEHVPDNFEAHVWLANHYLDEDQPARSEPHVEAARRLKPRDPATERLCGNQQITAIRCLAIARRFKEAREQWERTVASPPDGIEVYTLDALRAGIEFRAKQDETAREYVDAALEKVGNPAPVLAQMSAVGARYKLKREIKKEFDEQFKQEIDRKLDSATAGYLARFFCAYRANQINYTGRATQERLFIKALHNTKGVQWQEADLKDVCMFLEVAPKKEQSLRTSMISKGLKKFPDNPFFHHFEAVRQYEFGPFRCNTRVLRQHLHEVVRLTRNSRSEEGRILGERAQEILSTIGPADPFFGGPFSFGGFDDPFGNDRDVFDDLFDDEDEFDTESGNRQLSFAFGDEENGEFDPPSLDALDPDSKQAVIDVLERMARRTGVNMDDVIERLNNAGGDDDD